MITLSRASANKNEGITIRTSQFKKLKFNNNEEYIIVFPCGTMVKMKTSRNGKTLYAPLNAFPSNFLLPHVGHNTQQNIKIAKILKSIWWIKKLNA